jgi:hypothetical protein
VQDAQEARVQIVPRSGPLDDRAVGDAHGDRVDAEVAPGQVLVDARAQLDVGQRPRPRVALPAGACEVEDEPVGGDRRRPEALVHEQRAADALGGARRDRQRVAFDDQVQLARHLTAEGVANGAADDVDPRLPRDGGQDDVGAWGRAKGIHAVIFH